MKDTKNLEDLEFGNHLNKQTRKLAVRFRGSLNDFYENPNLTEWSVSTPKVFGVDEDDENGLKRLEDAILIGAKIKKIHSSFPCDINIEVSDIKNKNYVFSDAGTCHYLVYPKEINHVLDEVLLEPDESLNSDYLKEHIKYTPKNLLHDVVAIPNSTFSFVGKNNPLIKIINLNSEALQMSLTANDLVNDEFYKVDNAVLYDCSELLINELTNTFPITNLNEFKVNISRADRLDFNDPDQICDNVVGDAAVSKIMNSKRDLACILELTYSISKD